jgi:hypothetical protein
LKRAPELFAHVHTTELVALGALRGQVRLQADTRNLEIVGRQAEPTGALHTTVERLEHLLAEPAPLAILDPPDSWQRTPATL